MLPAFWPMKACSHVMCAVIASTPPAAPSESAVAPLKPSTASVVAPLATSTADQSNAVHTLSPDICAG
jgi:hypothetical protein